MLFQDVVNKLGLWTAAGNSLHPSPFFNFTNAAGSEAEPSLKERAKQVDRDLSGGAIISLEKTLDLAIS